ITGGQRLKKVLSEIVSTFAVIFIMMVLLKLFIIYAQWANDLEQEIGMVGVIILLIAGAWALIDAPDIVQRTMGIDAGLRSGWQAMAGAYAGTKMAGAGATIAGKGAGKVVKTGGKAAGGAGAGGVGIYKGIKDGKRNGNVKPVPPRNPDKGTSQNKQQYSTNAIGTSNAPGSNMGPSVNGSNTIPTNAIGRDEENNGTGKMSSNPNKSTPIVNTGRKGHIHPQRRHTVLGNNRTVQRAGHFLSRSHNTGYDI